MRWSQGLDPMSRQFRQELGRVEAVFRGMIEERAIDPSVKSVPGYFLEEEKASWFKNASNLSDARLPHHDMMEHPEIEHRIEVCVGKRQTENASCCKNDPPFKSACEPLPRAVNLSWIEVDSVDLPGAELLQQDLQAHAPAASGVEDPLIVQTSTQLAQQRSLVETLYQRTCRIVDEEHLRQVQLHAGAFVIRKYRTSGVAPASRMTLSPAQWATRSHSSLG